MTSALKNLLAHNQVDPGKYHVTLTLAWLLAVNHFMQNTVASVDADSFIQSHEQLMDVNLLETHYSQSLLYSDKAREHFVEPDISPIPTYG